MMNEKQKFLYQTLKETVEHYSPDPENLRSLHINEKGESYCRYVYPGDPNRRCGVGRLMSEKEAGELTEGLNITSCDQTLPDGFLEKYPINFLVDLQLLHDDLGENFWEEEGLTDLGAKRAERIKEDILSGRYTKKNTMKKTDLLDISAALFIGLMVALYIANLYYGGYL